VISSYGYPHLIAGNGSSHEDGTPEVELGSFEEWEEQAEESLDFDGTPNPSFSRSKSILEDFNNSPFVRNHPEIISGQGSYSESVEFDDSDLMTIRFSSSLAAKKIVIKQRESDEMERKLSGKIKKETQILKKQKKNAKNNKDRRKHKATEEEQIILSKPNSNVKSTWLETWETKHNQAKRDSRKVFNNLTQNASSHISYIHTTEEVEEDDNEVLQHEDRLVYKQCNIRSYIESRGKINKYCGKCAVLLD
jgi:vacuolar-type H+-ATPase subunit H